MNLNWTCNVLAAWFKAAQHAKIKLHSLQKHAAKTWNLEEGSFKLKKYPFVVKCDNVWFVFY